MSRSSRGIGRLEATAIVAVVLALAGFGSALAVPITYHTEYQDMTVPNPQMHPLEIKCGSPLAAGPRDVPSGPAGYIVDPCRGEKSERRAILGGFAVIAIGSMILLGVSRFRRRDSRRVEGSTCVE